MAKLQSVQNAAARIVAGLKKRDHITETLRDLHWLSVEERIVFKINLITSYHQSRTLRSSRDH